MDAWVLRVFIQRYFHTFVRRPRAPALAVGSLREVVSGSGPAVLRRHGAPVHLPPAWRTASTVAPVRPGSLVTLLTGRGVPTPPLGRQHRLSVRTPLLCIFLLAAGGSHVHAQPTTWVGRDSAKRLLAPEVFAGMPAAVRGDLARRGCRVPQASGPHVAPALARRPNNVVRGAFTAPGARDWAVLCSLAGVSRILVYRNGGTVTVDSLAPLGDGVHLGREPGHGWAYTRVLSAVGARTIRRRARAFDGPTPPPQLEHDGIDDAFAGKGSQVYYFYRGRWLILQGMD